MTSALLSACGGLGLFLLGMSVLTDGLKDIAGDALRNWLSRFTKSATTGAITGAVGTAVIQSSSATTVMAVGFVNAGLMTFTQSLGIIFGANIGTTVTGWLVALLGFKLSLDKIVLPVIFVGALLRLLGKRKLSATGAALAGFGLVFVGISMLQQGMEVFKDVVTPDSFPPDTIWGRLLLVLIGIAITLITQSSSAGVATAITAVHVGNISLAQAAAMVIGMNVGTTVTAVMASVGASVDARRTGLAHVFYNLLTGFVGFVLLPFFVVGWDSLVPAAYSDPEVALVAFHSLFNLLGVALIVPFTSNFARLIIWLVPSSGSDLTRRLDQSLLGHPAMATAAVRATLEDLTAVVFKTIASGLAGNLSAPAATGNVKLATEEVRRYLTRINTTENDGQIYQDHVSALHVVDHLGRLIVRFQRADRLRTVCADPELRPLGNQLAQVIAVPLAGDETIQELTPRLEKLWGDFDRQMEPFRRRTIERLARDEDRINETLARLDAIRWLRRVCYHSWRICFHLSGEEQPTQGVDVEPDSVA